MFTSLTPVSQGVYSCKEPGGWIPRPHNGPGNNVGGQVGNYVGVKPVQLGNYSGADNYTTGKGRHSVTRRLVVRRTRLTDTVQQRLWPEWRHHGFLTDLDGDAVTIDAFHRRHAVVELAIRDLKEGAGLDHVPSGKFSANAAWLCCCVLAHNLIRWTDTLGEITPAEQLTVARTMRTRLIAIPGRLVNRSGVATLRLPTRWPWADTFTRALHQLRALNLAPG